MGDYDELEAIAENCSIAAKPGERLRPKVSPKSLNAWRATTERLRRSWKKSRSRAKPTVAPITGGDE